MINQIEIMDEATPLIKWIIDTKPDWMRAALKSTGWWMQKEIKSGIRSGAPGGRRYHKFMPAGMRQRLEAAYTDSYSRANHAINEVGAKRQAAAIKWAQGYGGDKKRYPPLGRLAAAVGYQYDKNTASVRVGWLSKSAAMLGTKHEEGASRTVTDKMRNYFWMADIPLGKSKKKITLPKRETFSPMRATLAPKAAAYVDKKLRQYFKDGPPASGKGRRRYKVVKGM